MHRIWTKQPATESATLPALEPEPPDLADIGDARTTRGRAGVFAARGVARLAGYFTRPMK